MARNQEFPAGIGKWVRNQSQPQVTSCFFSVSFLKPVRAGLSPFTSHYMAVDLRNYNLQDEFLPSHPQKPPWRMKHTPHQPKAYTAPLAVLGGVSSTLLGGNKEFESGELPRDKDRGRGHRGVGAAQVSLLFLCCAGGRVGLIAAPRQR